MATTRRRWAVTAAAAVVVAVLVGVAVMLRGGSAGPTPPRQAPSPTGSAFVQPGWRRPPFAASVEPLSGDRVARMTGRSWRPGCPVAPVDLRALRLTFWGFDQTVHEGELVVNADVADALTRVFRQIYDAGLPIREMRPVDDYDGDESASKSADNTSGFNCAAPSDPTAMGRAVDLNPVENPAMRGATVFPAVGATYLDRSNVRPGMIVSGDRVTAAFSAEGFVWGGERDGPKEYHHFEVAPR